MRRLFKKNDENGFTLAELLIVVAIIAVLVAISIPIFTTQLEKSRDAVTVANLRAAYAEAAVDALADNQAGSDFTVSKKVLCKGKSGTLSNLDKELPFDVNDSSIAILGAGNGEVTVTFTFTAGTEKCTATAAK